VDKAAQQATGAALRHRAGDAVSAPGIGEQQRAGRAFGWAAANGVTRLRSHIDWFDDRPPLAWTPGIGEQAQRHQRHPFQRDAGRYHASQFRPGQRRALKPCIRIASTGRRRTFNSVPAGLSAGRPPTA
jgi:hypothetical protein